MKHCIIWALPLIIAFQCLLTPFSHADEATLPEKAVLHVVLMQGLNSDSALVGQKVEARIFQPLYLGKQQLLTGQETLSGVVTMVNPAQPGQNGLIGFAFSQLNLPGGHTLPIKASVITHNKDKPFFGGDGTLGTVATRYPYHNAKLIPYNRVLLQGNYNYGVPTELRAGEMVDIKLEEAITLPLH